MPISNRKWFVDTNVLLDIASDARGKFHDDAILFYGAAGKSDVKLYASVAVLKDAYYLLCRNYCDESKARKAVRFFMDTFTIVDLTGAMAEMALDSNEPDFEDGLIRVSADMCECKYIVSRDVKAFKEGSAKRLEPLEAYRLLTNGASAGSSSL